MRKFLFLSAALLVFQAPAALAGYFEIGLSGNYKKIYLPSDSQQNASDQSQSMTTSLAYYFYEMAAIEFNYTKGKSRRFVPSSVANVKTTHYFGLVGTDLIFTFAKRKAPFVPYVKIGAGYFIEKEVAYEYDDKVNPITVDVVRLEKTLVPSAGAGFRMRLTERMSFKLGLEVWSSDALQNDPQLDWAGKAGVSWFL